jgi:hypothetical protein
MPGFGGLVVNAFKFHSIQIPGEMTGKRPSGWTTINFYRVFRVLKGESNDQ